MRNLNDDEYTKVNEIAKRYIKMMKRCGNFSFDHAVLVQDISLVHRVIPLDLQAMLDAGGKDFADDVCAMLLNINRDTRVYGDRYEPRFSVAPARTAATVLGGCMAFLNN